MSDGGIRVKKEALESFCQRVFCELGLDAADAAIAASVLVAADLRGIPSHGVARLPRYVKGLEIGLMVPSAAPSTIRETETTVVVDARGGMGAPVSVRTMRRVIRKAQTSGTAFGSVRNSNHFGIAGYYAMMPLDYEMIGIAMTNTAALAVPTFGRLPMVGTNPIAVAAPASREGVFVLDMATTVVTRGKVEVHERAGKALPHGWAVDPVGQPASQPAEVLHNLTHQVGGGILPLGGLGELLGGHKGFSLSVLVDILCGVLSASAFGPAISDEPGSSARVSHFFGAIAVSSFRNIDSFKRDMDRLLVGLRESPPARGATRVYYAGLKEREHEAQCLGLGVPLPHVVYDELVAVARAQGLAPPLPL